MSRTIPGIREALQRFGQFLSLGLFAALLSSCSSSLGGSSSPQKYNCGDLTHGHCYSEGTLGPRLTGFRTTMTVANKFIPGKGFVNNEFWLENTDGNWGWIEIGYEANPVQLTKYFWALLNPETGIYQSHDIGTIPQGEFGTRVTFDVHQTADSTFAISVDGTVTHFQTTAVVPLWAGNFGGAINLGTELAGDSGASASLAEFVDNQVYDQKFRMRFADSTDNPSEDVGKPPFGGWMQKPATGNRGGVFATYCCVP